MEPGRGFAIVADDLTGACDAALQFWSAGCPSFVSLRGSRPQVAANAVVAFDLDSRDAQPEDAYQRAQVCAGELHQAGLHLGYKKVDSTLRGNLGAEFDALLDAGLADAIILAPAFPSGGRVVRAGCLYVDGLPLDATPFAAALQQRSSRVAEVVGAGGRRQAGEVELAQVRAGTAVLAAALDAALSQGAQVVVVDAESDADLRCIAAVLAERPRWLAAGSAGLAEALAAPPQPGAVPTAGGQASAAQQGAGPVLLVIGSRNPASITQLAFLAEQPGVAVVTVDAEALGAGQAEGEILRCAEQVARELAQGSDVVLTPDPAQPAQLLDYARTQAVAQALARIVALGGATAKGMLITGGSTAAAVLPALGVGLLEVAGVVQPGVPLLLTRDGRADLRLVTKAGGFGSRDVLAAARSMLRQI